MPTRVNPISWQVPLLILLLGGLLGTNSALAKGLVDGGLAPLSLLIWLQAGTAAVLLAAMIFRRERLPGDAHTWAYGLALGMLSLSVPSAIAFTTLPHIGAGTYTATFTLSPLCTFVLRWIVDRQYPGPRRLLGIGVGGLGAAALVVAGMSLTPGKGVWLALALATPVFLASGNLVRERLMPEQATRLQLCVVQPVTQLLLFAPLAWASGTPIALPELQWRPQDVALLLQVAISSVVYPLFFRLQSIADAVALSQVGYATVAAGVLWGAALYGEDLSPWMGPALMLLFIGLRTVQSARC